MNQTLNSFMKEYFNGLVLRPGLFYLWKYGIRFEISNPFLSFEDQDNLEQVYKRITRLFNGVFKEGDEILLVTDVHCNKGDSFLQKKPLNVYRKYVKDKKTLAKLRHKVLPSVFIDDEDDEDYSLDVTHRFVLPCTKNEIRYIPLLLAISYEDFRHPSCILKSFPQYGYDIYFVNITKKMIYHLYDDRGCDVLASDKEDLRYLYQEYNDWILDYDRKEIDQLFEVEF